MKILGSCMQTCQPQQEIWRSLKKVFIPASRMWLIPRGTLGTASLPWMLLSTSCLQNWTNDSNKSGLRKSLSFLSFQFHMVVLVKLRLPFTLCFGIFESLCYCNQVVGLLWMLKSILTENLGQLCWTVILSKYTVADLPALI